MKLFEKHRFRKFILSIGLLSVLSIAGFDINLGRMKYVERLESLTNDLVNFVSKHQGRFPESLEEFKPYMSSENQYRRFWIYYGIRADEFMMEHNQLYDQYHCPVLLVEGKNKGVFWPALVSRAEKRCTLNLYKHMKTYSGKSKEVGVKSDVRKD